MSFIDQLNQITAAKAKLAAQEQTIFQEREQALAKLPASHGYADLKSFIKALKAAAGSSPKSKKATKTPKAAKPAKRTRAKITPELKQQVLTAIQEGKTGAEIVKAFGLSLPSVQNIKKEVGLVKVRASSGVAPAAPAAEAASEAPAPSEGAV